MARRHFAGGNDLLDLRLNCSKRMVLVIVTLSFPVRDLFLRG